MKKYFLLWLLAFGLSTISQTSHAADWYKVVFEGKAPEEVINYQRKLIENRNAVVNPTAVEYNGKFVVLAGPYTDERVSEIKQNFINKGMDPNSSGIFFQLTSKPRPLNTGAATQQGAPQNSSIQSQAGTTPSAGIQSNLPKCAGSYYDEWNNCVGKAQFPSGDIFFGEFINGLPNGKGVWNLKNGRRYEGEVKDGKYSGKGTLYIPGQAPITATWIENKTEADYKKYQQEVATYCNNYISAIKKNRQICDSYMRISIDSFFSCMDKGMIPAGYNRQDLEEGMKRSNLCGVGSWTESQFAR